MIPAWLHYLSISYLALGWLCAAGIAADLLHHPQHMWIMNFVWPITALFGTAWILWQYVNFGRVTSKASAPAKGYNKPSNTQPIPFPMMVANGALHCGSGCTIGDVLAEWLAFAFPALAVALGWQQVFPDKIFAIWVLDYAFAYVFGIIFQYFTIAPMRGLSFSAGIVAAVKADTLSLTAWQIGMYGFMAFASFFIFRIGFNATLKVNSFEFWFMMQIAMMAGFATAYPANWWLIKRGLKEKM